MKTPRKNKTKIRTNLKNALKKQAKWHQRKRVAFEKEELHPKSGLVTLSITTRCATWYASLLSAINCLRAFVFAARGAQHFDCV